MSSPTFPELLRIFQADPLALANRVPGIFPVNKPAGPSSHRIVAIARRALGMKKVGHAGTLDPMADGLLLILAGRATRLFDHLQAFPKTYLATFCLGIQTDTQDCTGRITSQVDDEMLPVSRDRVAGALEKFQGEISQVPPMYSALKKDGQPLYRLARQGMSVERNPRKVTVYSLDLVKFDGVVGILKMTVSSGFYVRTLIHDLGLALGTGAHMNALTRTAIGPFSLELAVGPDDLKVADA